MTNNKEIEYNFIVNGPIGKISFPKFWTVTKTKSYCITDYYYDTEDRMLQKNKYVFRKRLNTDDSSIKYAIKGPTMVIDGVPERLEIESEYKDIVSMELAKRLPGVIGKESDQVQARITYRTDHVFEEGFTMSIDVVTYMDTGAGYTSIELELNNPKKIQQLKNYRLELIGKTGVLEWRWSKFHMGEAITALGIKSNPLTTEDLEIIDKYLWGKKEKI